MNSVAVHQKERNLLVRELRNELESLGGGVDEGELNDLVAVMPLPSQF